MSSVRRSMIKLAAFRRQREVSIDGRLVCVMDWLLSRHSVAFLWSWTEQEPSQAVMQPEGMLSLVRLPVFRLCFALTDAQ